MTENHSCLSKLTCEVNSRRRDEYSDTGNAYMQDRHPDQVTFTAEEPSDAEAAILRESKIQFCNLTSYLNMVLFCR